MDTNRVQALRQVVPIDDTTIKPRYGIKSRSILCSTKMLIDGSDHMSSCFGIELHIITQQAKHTKACAYMRSHIRYMYIRCASLEATCNQVNRQLLDFVVTYATTGGIARKFSIKTARRDKRKCLYAYNCQI